MQFFFKTMSGDGKIVSVHDMRKMLKDSKLNEELAEEYVERTAGATKAKHFTLE